MQGHIYDVVLHEAPALVLDTSEFVYLSHLSPGFADGAVAFAGLPVTSSRLSSIRAFSTAA